MPKRTLHQHAQNYAYEEVKEGSNREIRVADLTSVFGSLKGKLKLSGQQLKDIAREGWDDDDD